MFVRPVYLEMLFRCAGIALVFATFRMSLSHCSQSQPPYISFYCFVQLGTILSSISETCGISVHSYRGTFDSFGRSLAEKKE